MTAEQFFDARMAACRAIAADLGEHWHLVEGASYWCTIPSRLRSFKTARGTKIYCRADARLPAGKYWPAGSMPDGLIVAPDYARDRTPREVILRIAAERKLASLESDYATARHNAASRNRSFHRWQHDPEYRADAIFEAWNLRRELIQARRDAATQPADDVVPMAA